MTYKSSLAGNGMYILLIQLLLYVHCILYTHVTLINQSINIKQGFISLIWLIILNLWIFEDIFNDVYNNFKDYIVNCYNKNLQGSRNIVNLII